MGRGSNDTGFIDLVFEELSPREMISKAESFYQEMNKRRTTRHFSTREVSRSLIEAAIKTAGTAPSGAHLQPWTFVAISNQELKISNGDLISLEEIRNSYETGLRSRLEK